MVNQMQAMRRAFDGLISSTVMEQLVTVDKKPDLTSVPDSNAEIVISKMNQCSFRHGTIPVIFAMMAKAGGASDAEVAVFYNEGLVMTDRLTPADTVSAYSFTPITQSDVNGDTRSLRIGVTVTNIQGVRRSDSIRHELCETTVPVRNIKTNIDTIAKAIYQVRLLHPSAEKTPNTPVVDIKKALTYTKVVSVNHRVVFHQRGRG